MADAPTVVRSPGTSTDSDDLCRVECIVIALIFRPSESFRCRPNRQDDQAKGFESAKQTHPAGPSSEPESSCASRHDDSPAPAAIARAASDDERTGRDAIDRKSPNHRGAWPRRRLRTKASHVRTAGSQARRQVSRNGGVDLRSGISRENRCRLCAFGRESAGGRAKRRLELDRNPPLAKDRDSVCSSPSRGEAK